MIGLLQQFNEWLNEWGYELGQTLTGQLESGSPLALAVVFAAGVATSFTPCVYPMIPVTVSFIGGSAAGSRRRAISLSAVYALGLALVYTGLGIVTALLGKTFGEISQSWWINLLVGLLIAVFGLAMLDVFTVRVPAVFGSVQSQGARRGGHAGALVMGVAAGFIAAPCTAPVLGVLLVYVARKQDVTWGGLLLFVFSIGLSFLLIVLGISAGMLSSLPRAGAWMVLVKRSFGVAMLVVGAVFLWKALRVFL